jgi:ribonuclease P/MRP protein subunit POP5
MVRFKNRWLLVEFIPFNDGTAHFSRQLSATSQINSKQIWNALKQSVIVNFGDAGWGAIGYSLTGQSCAVFM